MAAATVNDEEFMRLFKENGPSKTAQTLGLSSQAIYQRRRNIENRLGVIIDAPNLPGGKAKSLLDVDAAINLDIENGTVIVGSDAHYWPGAISTMHRALVSFCKEKEPTAIIMNGDIVDGARISRHAPIGWEDRPSVVDEIETCQARLGEIELAAPKAIKTWPLGNHDARFETRLATVAPEYARVHGVHLQDHFPLWEPCWLTVINDDVIVKHRYKGGIHATHNNTLWSGKTIITGHLHSAKVTPFTDYNGTRYGVDTGTLCEAPWIQAVDYLEAGPVNWRSAFCVLKFHNGRLLQPQLVYKIDNDHVEYCNEVYSV